MERNYYTSIAMLWKDMNLNPGQMPGVFNFDAASGIWCQQHLMKPHKHIGLNLVMLTRQRPLPWPLPVVATEMWFEMKKWLQEFQCHKQH